MSAGWDGYYNRGSGSTIAKHEWKGLMKKGGRLRERGLEDYVEKRAAEDCERYRVPGHLSDDDC